jgi:hypothetical protein
MEKISKNKIKRAWQLLADRTLDDTFFLGWAVNEYKKANNFNDKQLENWLECSSDNIKKLLLCRLPDDKSEYFQEDVIKIAKYVSCNPDKLIMLIREVASVESLKMNSEELSDGLLMAARDRKKIDEEDED